MPTARDACDLIGSTPILRLGRLCPNAQVFAKCEFLNPYSVKDRVVRQILDDAEADGRLVPGGTIIESTSGNTGIALASIGAIRGYRVILCMSEMQSIERRQVLAALGAELILTPAAEGTGGSRRRMHQIMADHPDYFYLGQHVNPSNPRAHYAGTGPELWEQTAGKVDILVAGLGTGGTICGTGRYLKELKPTLQTVAVEPAESPFISQGIFRPHRMMGTAPGFVPETLDLSLVDEIQLVHEEDAFEACRQIARREGLLVGISSGACAHAAQQLAARPENVGKVIVAIFADTGQRYLSVSGLFAQVG